jgi:serine/threonine protein phosphatase PrpC
MNKSWKVVMASATGTAHLSQNGECQDRFSAELFGDDKGQTLIAAVADGAGSTSDGHLGAEIACRSFIREVQRFLKCRDAQISSLNEEFGKLWISSLQAELRAIAKDADKPLREFASTFIAAVVGEECGAFFQIGDGAAVFSESGQPGSYRFAISPDDSEYVNTTDFITDDSAETAIRFYRVGAGINELILFTDGVFPVAVDYQANQPHEPFLMPMMAPLRSPQANEAELSFKLASFLSSAKISEKTDDDKTMILARRS